MKRYVSALMSLLIINNAFAEGIRDIKPPVAFAVNRVLIFLLFLAAAAALAAVFLYMRHRRTPFRPEPQGPIRRPDEEALSAISALLEKKLIEQGYFREFYFELSDIVRHYLEARFGLPAPEKTTEEFLIMLKSSTVLCREHRALLSEFLQHCDLVKFAKYAPEGAEVRRSIDSATRLIEQTREVDEGTSDAV